MDNREYLRRLFSDRKVILALVITAFACVLSYFCAKLLEGQFAQSAGQVVCALLMFSQLIIIGKTANRISSELEAEAQKDSKKLRSGKKKSGKKR